MYACSFFIFLFSFFFFFFLLSGDVRTLSRLTRPCRIWSCVWTAFPVLVLLRLVLLLPPRVLARIRWLRGGDVLAAFIYSVYCR